MYNKTRTFKHAIGRLFDDGADVLIPGMVPYTKNNSRKKVLGS